MAGEGFPWWLELTEDDRLMTSLPLFHINAPAYSVLGLGGRAREPRRCCRASRRAGSSTRPARHGATEFNAIGAMLEILMRQPERPDDADNPLRLGYAGPTPPEERHLEFERALRARDRVRATRCPRRTYGTVWRARHAAVRHARLAAPAPDARRGQRGARETRDGELELRNPAVMKGYWGMPEETEPVLAADGWLRTGDLVRENATAPTRSSAARRR